MVTLVVGFPGSGKSYYAVDKIYNLLSNEKIEEYKNIDVIYSNINGIKFDTFPSAKLEFKKFDIDDFYRYLTQCYSLYVMNKNKDSVDDILIEFSKKSNYHNCLIVFDECHDFFTQQDKVKIFWLTYHRHLFHEIILLTQNKTLIHSKYRAIPEIFIEAQARSKKLFANTLTYKKYASFAMRTADYFGKDSLKTKDEVFALYQSGNKSSQKSILHKYIFLGVVSVLLVGLVFYNILSSYIQDQTVEPITDTTAVHQRAQSVSNSRTVPKSLLSKKELDYFVVSFLCDNKNGCIFYNNTYPLSYINKFVSSTNSKKLHTNFLHIDKKKQYRLFKLFIYTSKNDLKRYFTNIDKAYPSTKRKSFNNTIPSPLEKIKL